MTATIDMQRVQEMITAVGIGECVVIADTHTSYEMAEALSLDHIAGVWLERGVVFVTVVVQATERVGLVVLNSDDLTTMWMATPGREWETIGYGLRDGEVRVFPQYMIDVQRFGAWDAAVLWGEATMEQWEAQTSG
jgi:hypothetical protein